MNARLVIFTALDFPIAFNLKFVFCEMFRDLYTSVLYMNTKESVSMVIGPSRRVLSLP